QLVPELTAEENVALPLLLGGVRRRAALAQAQPWFERLDLAGLQSRRSGELSGGQAQRVAIARALAAEPRMLLLDEPMAALDITVVPGMRQLLRRVLEPRSAIIVTHDVLDALLLADHVVVMEAGRIVEQGPTRDVLARPRSSFGAGIAGLNLARGRVESRAVRTAGGLVVAGLHGDDDVPEGAHAVAVFSPGAVSVHRERPTGSPRNVYTATVRELEPRGSQVRIQTDEMSADVTVPVVAELDLVPGTEVFLAVKASEVAIYEA
ncbi:MAG: Molybdenum transporter ATP-binding protein, partial [Aeromicrobium sp.]|nr:Molybdenum transporter ATP-binding protein [Aeromicrobium sp.]